LRIKRLEEREKLRERRKEAREREEEARERGEERQKIKGEKMTKPCQYYYSSKAVHYNRKICLNRLITKS
jgi:hypothetical protein